MNISLKSKSHATRKSSVLEKPKEIRRAPHPHRFTVKEYHRMWRAKALSHDKRWELIDGKIYERMTVGSLHLGIVNRINQLLTKRLSDDFLLQCQNPVHLDEHSEPVPDFTILKARADYYCKATARPDETLLAIEISDSSLSFDLKVKAELYARTGVPEYWVVAVRLGKVYVFRKPENGVYSEVLTLLNEGALTSSAVSGLTVAISDLLGGAESR